MRRIRDEHDEIFVSQTKYAKEFLRRFRVNDSELSKTPMTINVTIDSDASGKEVNIT
jgi:hypothetical protein